MNLVKNAALAALLAAGLLAPLAHGLPADPVAAARAYVAANRDLLGLTQSGAAALELLAVAPMGRGAAVLFRQRFGSLPAGVDGLLAVGVRGGAAYYVSSSLARSSAAPADATLSAAAAQVRSPSGWPCRRAWSSPSPCSPRCSPGC